MPALQPQAALEQAALDLLRDRLGYAEKDSGRTFDAQPPPRMGDVYLAVWSPADRQSASATALDERFGVAVTVTRRARVPFDRLVQVRDDVEARLNAVRALLHQDVWSKLVINAANTLAGLSNTQAGRAAGFVEGLQLVGFDRVLAVAPDWFHASGNEAESGLQQTARFGKARRVQAIPTAT